MRALDPDCGAQGRRRYSFAESAEEHVSWLLERHFEGLDSADVVTTNRPEALEAALAGRPGRIDQAIEFPLPDDDGRRRLIDLYRRGLELPESLRAALIPRTEGVSAAFIKELLRRGAQLAFERDSDTRELRAADLDSALCELLFEGGTLNAKLLGARTTS